MAYGPTGSGKTYTIQGKNGGASENEYGLLQRSMKYLFKKIKNIETKYKVKFKVEITYIEIYNG